MSRQGATAAHCKAETGRLTERFPETRGNAGRIAEILASHCVSNRHASETVDAIIRRGRGFNGGTIRDIAFALQQRGPRNCARCNGTGYVSSDRDGVAWSAPCPECRKPRAESQAGLFETTRKGDPA